MVSKSVSECLFDAVYVVDASIAGAAGMETETLKFFFTTEMSHGRNKKIESWSRLRAGYWRKMMSRKGYKLLDRFFFFFFFF